MAAGLVALAGGVVVSAGAPPFMGAVMAAPGWVILRTLVAIVDASASVPFATVSLGPPLDVAAAAISAGILAGVTWWRRRRPTIASSRDSPTASTATRPANARGNRVGAGRTARRAGAMALAVAVAVAGGVVAARPASVPRVTILDVGQGDAILVEGSRGGRLLIDGGPDPDRLLVALDRRIPPWDRRIDAVVLSHPHEDHVAGLAVLLERYQVDRVFEPGMRGPGPGYAAWLRELSGPGAPIALSLAAGDRLAVDEIDLRVLWPIRGRVPNEPPDGGTGINNVSVVLLGQVGPRRFLLMGDVEEGIDPALLADGLPRVDLLKIAHHGSRTATTQAFVDAVRPGVAVASAGAGNPYGHPARATLERLAASGARVLRTDRDGTVIAAFEADGMTIRTEGARTTASAISGSVASAATRAPAFLCAIPVTALVPERQAPAAARNDPTTADPGHAATVGYHRADARPWAGGRRLLPAPPRSPALVRAPRARRGVGRRLAGRPDRVQRCRLPC